MATIQVKGSKAAPQVDLTPMVDLGFLLIAFFMFTASISDPSAMVIQMPYKGDEVVAEPPQIKESTAMTILLGKDHEVFYYFGLGQTAFHTPKLEKTAFADQGGIRDAIIQKKVAVKQLVSVGALQPEDKMTVIIKATGQSTADDFVAILDEMAINTVPIYSVTDITAEELALMQ